MEQIVKVVGGKTGAVNPRVQAVQLKAITLYKSRCVYTILKLLLLLTGKSSYLFANRADATAVAAA
eukprot:14370-Heterococcus_DN1.PRE.1